MIKSVNPLFVDKLAINFNPRNKKILIMYQPFSILQHHDNNEIMSMYQIDNS